jgi:diadenosine tetraphosphatase ApaH/serine/threonine PP2A family protein phosphatase
MFLFSADAATAAADEQMPDGTLDFESIFQAIQEDDHLPETVIVALMHTLRDIRYPEPNVLELRVPITVCGDTHGQIFDLFQLFEISGHLADETTIEYLSLGDYVDRGYYSLETLGLLAALKVKYPSRVFLLRGNDESRQVNHMHGFCSDCMHVYGHIGVWTLCNEIFDLLPITALIAKAIFCVHGGLSKNIDFVEQFDLIVRRTELPAEGPLCDVCWSDPDDVEEWVVNKRGAGWLFGWNQVKKFLQLNGLRFMARSDQMVMEGFQWYFDNSLITVWSAPNYMYRAGNKACVMKLSSGLDVDIRIFEPHEDSLRRKPEDLPAMPYFA